MSLVLDKILDTSVELGFFVKETSRSLILKCPGCGKDKLYFEKNEHFFKCFSGSCDNSGNYIKLFSQMRGIDWKDAKNEFWTGKKRHEAPILDLGLKTEKKSDILSEKIELPIHFVDILDPQAKDGVEYLETRGVSVEIAKKYDIMYSPVTRRVVFLQKNEYGFIMGYQARAIDPVDKSLRMRNNDGYRKGQNIMFWDKAFCKDLLIVAEGPFDAIKFDGLGGNVATLGKELSQKQLMMINDSAAKTIYWAMDDDADNLIPGYASSVCKDSFIIKPPPEAIFRISAMGRKADFGECTKEECALALSLAKKVDDLVLF